MPQRQVLTDRRLKALKPAAAGQRYRIWDAIQPHLAVRVTDKGAKSLVVVKRQPGARSPYVHVLGTYPAVSLKAAREAVPAILQTLSEGKSPKEVKREEARTAARRRADTFGSAVEKFIEWEAGRKLRSAHETTSVLRREFLGMKPKRTKKPSKRGDGQATEWVTEWLEGKDPIWRDRPIVGITRRDVIERLDQIKARSGKHAARHSLGAVRKLFNWAEEGERFGLTESPAARVRDKSIGITGKDLKRSRVLSDEELRDVWNAAEGLGYPSGRLVQMLMLTGQRLNDIARMRNRELDLSSNMLRVPEERFKKGFAHEVPLTKMALEIIAAVPKFTAGFLFTTTGGARPVGAFSKMKAKLDDAVAKARKERRAERMEPWVLHDLRRTVRTRLVTDCDVDAFIAERVMGHLLPGLHRVYDQGTHRPQKRAALEGWEALLLSIVEPPPEKSAKAKRPPGASATVVPMRKWR